MGHDPVLPAVREPRNPDAMTALDRRQLVNFIVLDGWMILSDLLSLVWVSGLDPMADATGGPLFSDLMQTVRQKMSVEQAKAFYRGKFTSKVMAILG